MKYISKSLAKEITQKYNYMQSQEKFKSDSVCDKIVSKEIEKEAQFQSFKIENPNSAIPYSIPRNSNKKKIKTGIKNIENAYLWGIKNFDPENFDECFIREISGKILPDLHYNMIAQYRTERVRIIGASKIPPDPYKVKEIEIPWLVNSIRYQFNEIYSNPNEIVVIKPIIASIFTHFHIARIHPFIDGNGRTARTMQDIILSYYHIPVPIISSRERYSYYDYLNDATVGWYNNKAEGKDNIISEGEKDFFEFVASKINSSLDTIIEKCH